MHFHRNPALVITLICFSRHYKHKRFLMEFLCQPVISCLYWWKSIRKLFFTAFLFATFFIFREHHVDIIKDETDFPLYILQNIFFFISDRRNSYNPPGNLFSQYKICIKFSTLVSFIVSKIFPWVFIADKMLWLYDFDFNLQLAFPIRFRWMRDGKLHSCRAARQSGNFHKENIFFPSRNIFIPPSKQFTPRM